mmetsp:Transcript_35398/g.74660  ORF Transcript_35398/g.74660 Transcript_35398/m.74660 type:complete len:102 (+) Transcript_35398:157-462(+)
MDCPAVVISEEEREPSNISIVEDGSMTLGSLMTRSFKAAQRISPQTVNSACTLLLAQRAILFLDIPRRSRKLRAAASPMKTTDRYARHPSNSLSFYLCGPS